MHCVCAKPEEWISVSFFFLHSQSAPPSSRSLSPPFCLSRSLVPSLSSAAPALSFALSPEHIDFLAVLVWWLSVWRAVLLFSIGLLSVYCLSRSTTLHFSALACSPLPAPATCKGETLALPGEKKKKKSAAISTVGPPHSPPFTHGAFFSLTTSWILTLCLQLQHSSSAKPGNKLLFRPFKTFAASIFAPHWIFNCLWFFFNILKYLTVVVGQGSLNDFSFYDCVSSYERSVLYQVLFGLDWAALCVNCLQHCCASDAHSVGDGLIVWYTCCRASRPFRHTLSSPNGLLPFLGWVTCVCVALLSLGAELLHLGQVPTANKDLKSQEEKITLVQNVVDYWPTMGTVYCSYMTKYLGEVITDLGLEVLLKCLFK